ncbi:MAG: hypothetical protein Q9184_006424 [Pyrenodesmia sp. 2 TL-2023]
MATQVSDVLDKRAFRLDQLASLLDEGAFLEAIGTPTDKFITAALNGEELFTQEDLDLREPLAVEGFKTKDEFERKLRKEIHVTREG